MTTEEIKQRAEKALHGWPNSVVRDAIIDNIIAAFTEPLEPPRPKAKRCKCGNEPRLSLTGSGSWLCKNPTCCIAGPVNDLDAVGWNALMTSVPSEGLAIYWNGKPYRAVGYDPPKQGQQFINANCRLEGRDCGRLEGRDCVSEILVRLIVEPAEEGDAK